MSKTAVQNLADSLNHSIQCALEVGNNDLVKLLLKELNTLYNKEKDKM